MVIFYACLLRIGNANSSCYAFLYKYALYFVRLFYIWPGWKVAVAIELRYAALEQTRFYQQKITKDMTVFIKQYVHKTN